MIYRTAPFSRPKTTPTTGFKVTPFFDAEYLRNGPRYRYNLNGILGLLGNYTRQHVISYDFE